MRRKLPPKPSPLPPGKMAFGLEIIDVEELEEVCKQTLEWNDEVPKWNEDPSYNWRKPRRKR